MLPSIFGGGAPYWMLPCIFGGGTILDAAIYLWGGTILDAAIYLCWGGMILDAAIYSFGGHHIGCCHLSLWGATILDVAIYLCGGPPYWMLPSIFVGATILDSMGIHPRIFVEGGHHTGCRLKACHRLWCVLLCLVHETFLPHYAGLSELITQWVYILADKTEETTTLMIVAFFLLTAACAVPGKIDTILTLLMQLYFSTLHTVILNNTEVYWWSIQPSCLGLTLVECILGRWWWTWH